MSRKTVKTIQETVNTDTGEVMRVHKWHTQAVNREEFVRLMMDNVSRFYQLTKGEYDVLMGALKEVDYNSTLYADKTFKKSLANRIGKTEGTIATILSALVKKGMLKRLNRGRYELNPTMLWKGKDVDRLKRVEFYKQIERVTQIDREDG